MTFTALSRHAALLLLAALWSASAAASRSVHESLSSVLARSGHAVVAEILDRDEFDPDRHAHAVVVDAAVEEVLAGAPITDETLRCRYTEARVQRRGDATVSPLVSGSGEEFRLRRGERVILLLAPLSAAAPPATDAGTDAAAAERETEEDDAETCTLLRVEPLQNRREILMQAQPQR